AAWARAWDVAHGLSNSEDLFAWTGRRRVDIRALLGSRRSMSAVPPTAPRKQTSREVRVGPNSEIASILRSAKQRTQYPIHLSRRRNSPSVRRQIKSHRPWVR